MLIQQAQLLKRLGLPGNVYVCPIHGARRVRNSDDSKGLTSFFDVQYTGKWSTNKAHLAEARANLCPYMRELYRDCSVDPEIVTQIVTPPKALTHAERQKVYRARHKA